MPTSASRRPAAGPSRRRPGERVFVLSVPFEDRRRVGALGARWDAAWRQTVYVGARLPAGLVDVDSPDYSWERWVEDDVNGSVRAPAPPRARIRLREHQVVAAGRIAAAARAGWRGFVQADDVGLGKTAAVWAGVLQVAGVRPVRRVLVLCPKGVVDHWRATIAAVGHPAGLRVCVINYDRVKRLLSVPGSAAAAKRVRTRNRRIAAQGASLVDWDVVVFDESHLCRNAGSQRAQAAARVARYAAAGEAAPFVVWVSATIGQNPLELGYLAPLLAQLTGATRSDLRDFGPWLREQGYHVEHSARFDRWEWCPLPADATPAQVAAVQRRRDGDVARMHRLLFADPQAPAIRRLPTDIAGWPQVQRILHPVPLDPVARGLYAQAWTQFRAALRLAHRGGDPRGGLVARLRFRQKASLLRVAGTVAQVVELVENGHQVAVSVEFLESLDAIRSRRPPLGQVHDRGPGGRRPRGGGARRGRGLALAFHRGAQPGGVGWTALGERTVPRGSAHRGGKAGRMCPCPSLTCSPR